MHFEIETKIASSEIVLSSHTTCASGSLRQVGRFPNHVKFLQDAVGAFRQDRVMTDEEFMENVAQRPEPQTHNSVPDGVIVLPPGKGRTYPCGPMQSVFLADGEETGNRYSVSIWGVKPRQSGPGPHAHADNEELFYVIDGTMTFRVGDQYIDAVVGTFLRIPAGVTHDFENRTGQQAGVLNVFIPGGFEANMPEIVEWFRTHPQ